MSLSNEELAVLQKAITAANVLATYGKLNPEQAAKFLDYVVDTTVMKNNVRIVRFRNEKMEISALDIGNRVMFPGTEYQAPQERQGVSTSTISIQPQEVVCAFDISDTFKLQNIEGESVSDHIMRMFATGWGNNMEEIVINGDTVGPAGLESDVWAAGSTTQYVLDSLLKMFDGWWRKADGGHTVNMNGANIGISAFRKMLTAMPAKYKKNRRDLRWFMSDELADVYVEKVSTRQTAKGDRAAEGEEQAPLGIPLVRVPGFPFNPKIVQHVVVANDTAVALRYKPIVSASEVVTPSTLGRTPTTKYIEGTAYDMDYVNGTITNPSGDATIADGATVKITYEAGPQMLLTHWQNFILAFGMDDLKVERQRNIHKRADEYVMSGRFDEQIENLDAVVKGYNLGDSL